MAACDFYFVGGKKVAFPSRHSLSLAILIASLSILACKSKPSYDVRSGSAPTDVLNGPQTKRVIIIEGPSLYLGFKSLEVEPSKTKLAPPSPDRLSSDSSKPALSDSGSETESAASTTRRRSSSSDDDILDHQHTARTEHRASSPWHRTTASSSTISDVSVSPTPSRSLLSTVEPIFPPLALLRQPGSSSIPSTERFSTAEDFLSKATTTHKFAHHEEAEIRIPEHMAAQLLDLDDFKVNFIVTNKTTTDGTARLTIKPSYRYQVFVEADPKLPFFVANTTPDSIKTTVDYLAEQQLKMNPSHFSVPPGYSDVQSYIKDLESDPETYFNIDNSAEWIEAKAIPGVKEFRENLLEQGVDPQSSDIPAIWFSYYEAKDAARSTQIKMPNGDSITLSKHLGAGAQGLVYEAVWENLATAKKEKFVVKHMHIKNDDAIVSYNFANEVGVTRMLSGKASHVLTFDAGYKVSNPDGSFDIYTFSPLGTKIPDNLDESQHKALTRDIWEGLKEMHERGIVHRDLKIENSLLVNGRGVIIDLGMSMPIKHLDGTPHVGGSWSPPEFNQENYQMARRAYASKTGVSAETLQYDPKKTDVFSFATYYLDARLPEGAAVRLINAKKTTGITYEGGPLYVKGEAMLQAIRAEYPDLLSPKEIVVLSKALNDNPFERADLTIFEELYGVPAPQSPQSF
jgi:tRNA A-37 threonylcarbamoyl transferase component Bud32